MSLGEFRLIGLVLGVVGEYHPFFLYINQLLFSFSSIVYVKVATPNNKQLKNNFTTMAEMIMNDGKKWVEKEYASKGTANTALGLSIGALGLELLKNGGLNLGNILGNNNQTNPEETAFGLYKGYRDADDAIIAKHNADAFSLYKYSRDGFDALQGEIAELKTKLAVAEAVQPWKDKSIYDAIALEAERRNSADCSIVGYTNCTFYPVNVADVSVGTTSTPKTTYNPLNCLKPFCGC